MSPLIKYLAPLLQFILAIGGTLQLYLADNRLTALETWSFVAFLVAPAITFLVPLTRGRWPALLKTGLNAALGGVLVVVSALEDGEFVFDAATLTLIGLSVANALAVEIGVSARVTQTARAIADPAVSNVPVAEFDRGAYVVTALDRHNGT